MSGTDIPVLKSSSFVTGEQAGELLSKGLRPGQDFVSGINTKPIGDVPVLGHYRLVYESPTTVIEDGTHQIKDVKIFERVPGYTLAGEGTISIPFRTNQGREFTWIQQSVNGTFTLPYATTGNPYPVIATGPYTIAGTGKTVEVTEEEVMGK